MEKDWRKVKITKKNLTISDLAEMIKGLNLYLEACLMCKDGLEINCYSTENSYNEFKKLVTA